jgi:hypothetical protein
MKKVLIISYFYPPANYVGGERAASWAKYLHESDCYPIIVTRQWNQEQKNTYDKVEKNNYVFEKHAHYEIHRLPYRQSLRDRLFKYRNPFFVILRKLLTLIDIFLSCLSIRFIQYRNLYHKAAELIKSDKGIDTLIISGMPFESFYFGYKLKKKFPNIDWIPDYRDEWTTFQDTDSEGRMFHLILKYNRYFEKKWASNCAFFITVSDNWVKNIGRFIQKPGYVVMNGFDEVTLKESNAKASQNDFVICYNGTIYAVQNFDVFSAALLSVIVKYESKINIKLKFIGSDEHNPKIEDIKNKLNKHAHLVEVSPRIPKEELLEQLRQADLMLMTNYGKIRGAYPVKMFDYYMVRKPILLCPSDDDCIEKYILDINAGYIANDVYTCVERLSHLIEQKINGNPLETNFNEEKGKFYSRQNQAAILAAILNKSNEQ